mmetsp:Transcript_12614/g.30444  ORF Transcript_12614/g.30444 Transcript_12614/m.30444 type:complete len:321 (+) Transcript_12614:90-1052(+)
MDATDAFRASAATFAVRAKGLDRDRAHALCAPRALPPPAVRSPVFKSAYDTLGLVRELHAFIAQHRADYLREGNDSDGIRDGIESEVRLSVKAYQAHIGLLKSTVEETAAGRREGAQVVAHLHGVVLILTEYLQRVAASFDECREVRFKKVLAEAEHKRRRAPPPPPPAAPSGAKNAATSSSTSTSYPPSGEQQTQQQHQQLQQQVQHQQVQQQQQTRLSLSEGDLLVDELTGLVEQVRRAESKVVEMSALSSLFATHVQSQAAQIERLYTQAVESTRHLEGGNVELRKTISRRGDAQLYIAVLLFVATFGLVFLDWMSG